MFLLTTFAAASVVHSADVERIVVSNARLIGRDAPSGDVRVNLLIVGGKLVVVTKDDLVIESGDVAVDASAGFLFGQLVMGKRPSFVILDRDPREDFDVLLDTEAHVLFAIQEGVIVRNELPQAALSPPDATPEPRRWVAYTPPPIAVPIRYYDSRKWNKFNTKPISGLFTGAVVLDRQFWLSQDENSEAQVGDLSEFEGGKIRAFRIGVVGTLNFKRPWTYTVFATTHTFDKGFDTDTDDEFTWFDYRLDIPLPADLTLSVGKQKEPISLERLTPLTFLPWQERSAAADALLPARNHGLALSGTAAGDWFTWAVGAFNNWIDSDESFSDTSSQLVGRVEAARSRARHARVQPRAAVRRHRRAVGGRRDHVQPGSLLAQGAVPGRIRVPRHGRRLGRFRRPLLPRLSPQRFVGRHRRDARLSQAQWHFQSASGGHTGQPGRLGHARDRLSILAAGSDRRDGGGRRDGHLLAGSQLVVDPVGASRSELPVHLPRPHRRRRR
jgi:hypothetical protein